MSMCKLIPRNEMSAIFQAIWQPKRGCHGAKTCGQLRENGTTELRTDLLYYHSDFAAAVNDGNG